MKLLSALLIGTSLTIASPVFAHDHEAMSGEMKHCMLGEDCPHMQKSTDSMQGMDHGKKDEAHEHGDVAKTLAVKVMPQGELSVGKTTKMLMQIAGAKDGKPVSPDAISVVHTQRVHLLIIDPTLTDYHHIHPTPTDKAGEWAFDFTPKKNSSYRIWTDVTPAATGKQEYIKTDIGKSSITSHEMDKTLISKSEAGGYQFALSFDEPLVAEKPVMGKVVVTNKEGKPASNLQPVMGAFAHIVGFGEDGNTILHIHPMGKEPMSESERGGPELQFHIEPEKAGFVKLFVQTRIDDKDLFAPLGVTVK